MKMTCKKCGKEIPVNTNKDICESCRRKNGNKRNGLMSILGFVVSIALFILTNGKSK